MPRTCTGCQRQLGSTEFNSDSAPLCKACAAWAKLKRLAEVESGRLPISRKSFLRWFGLSHQRKCAYCGIAELKFAKLNQTTVRGTPVRSLEVHEIDSELGITPNNLHICCQICHRIRMNVFSHKEMLHVGRAIRGVWDARDNTRPQSPKPLTPAVRYNVHATR